MTVLFSGNCVLPESWNRLRNFESKTRIMMNGKMDEKEVEDRLVAAEAMSALASLVLVNPVSSATSPVNVDKPVTKKRAPRKKKEKGACKVKKIADKNENTNNGSGNLETGASVRPGRIVKANGTTKSKNSNSGNSGKSRKKSAGSKQTLATVAQSVTPAVTQCMATQTLPPNDEHIKNSLPSMNLGFPFFSSSNLNLGLISLPSIPSIEALKLSQNIDLAAFPNVNTVDLVLGGGYNRQQSVSFQQDGASCSGQGEGERSLPFKKRRYANTSEERGGGDAVMPSLDLSGATPFGSDKGKQPEKKSDPLRSLKFNPQFGSQLMREITVALTPDEDGDLPLHIAVVHENMTMIRKFIQLMKLARKSVDKFNKQKQTPLHLAVKLNLQDAIKMLLEADGDVNYVDQNGCTSLHLAVQNRLPRLIDLFYHNTHVPIDINTRNFEGFTPLHTAVTLNDDEMISILLEKGMDIDIVDGKSGRTALFHAVEGEKKAIVCLLLKKGANAEIQNYASNTAIMAAHARNLREISGLLTCKSNDIPDYEIDNSSRSSSVEIQDKPPGLIRVVDNPDTKLPEVSMTSLPTSIQSQSQTDFINPVMGEPFSMTGITPKTILDQPLDQPLDLHVEKKRTNESEKQVSPSHQNVPQKMDVDPQPDVKSLQAADIVMDSTDLVISISENGMLFTEQSSDMSKIPQRHVVTETISPSNQMSTNIPKLSERHSAIRTVLTSSVSGSVTSMYSSVTSSTPGVTSMFNSATSNIPVVTSDSTYPSQRTPAMIPSGIPTYIKPEVKARIQQNLMNKKLKAQLSEEKRD